MDTIKTLCLTLAVVLCGYNSIKSCLYRKSGLMKCILRSALWSTAIFIVGAALISFQHWIATTFLFFLTLVILVIFLDVFNKGDEYFDEIERLSEQKENRSNNSEYQGNTKSKSSLSRSAKIDKPFEHHPVFKNNRHQISKSSYTANELRQIAFTYIDRNENVTYREVSVNSFDGWKIKTYCLDKMANRTFTLSGVIGKITLRETGEQLSPDEWSECWKRK